MSTRSLSVATPPGAGPQHPRRLPRLRPRRGGGSGLAILSAATFGTSGTFSSALLASGWTPAAVVTTRVAIAALALTGPALAQLRGRWSLLSRSVGPLVAYGLVAVAACQLCYLHAVQRLDVGVALLLEYLGGVLVVGWMWWRHGQRPRALTAAGVLTAVVGLALVLGVTSPVRLDTVGVLWGLGGAVGCAGYYVLSARSDGALPPLVMAWAGMVVGALALAVAGLGGILPMRATTADVVLLHQPMSWLIPVGGVSLVAAAVAYATGIAAARRLGARLASFVGLTEVLFAIAFAWLLLGQLPDTVQLVGGVVILGGVAMVRAAEPAGEGADDALR